MPDFDIMVVGGGHAGCEAALAAARMGARTGLITVRTDRMATMPCNPSVGGIAKSHLVFEIDALGGEIGRNADYTGIQFRVLNMSKGPAVRANRVQCDKEAYRARMRAVVEATDKLEIVTAEVVDLLIENGRCVGTRLADGRTISAARTVLCSGTSLGGTLHIGDEVLPGGGGDLPAATRLSRSLQKLSLSMSRLKTGTPPRLAAKSLDYGVMEEQPGVIPPPFFSMEVRRLFHVEQAREAPPVSLPSEAVFYMEPPASVRRPWKPGSEQCSCYMTHTTEDTHRIIRDNLGRSSLYGGHITGTGVRYCPSVEDKIVKFPERGQHHVFIEPEGRHTSLTYPNGISNSLPREVQAAMVRSIPGLEKAEILAYGYAIEYDFVDPTQLRRTLEVRHIPGLYISGQVCGTTGYEEAAALGFAAGVNAVLSLRNEQPFVLGRDEGYLGVMIDDLVTKGTDEPYRMFTSRAEHRLLLRQDNARFRMEPHARRFGIVAQDDVDESRYLAGRIAETLDELKRARRRGRSLTELMQQLSGSEGETRGRSTALRPAILEQVEIERLYEGYIQRQREAVAKQSRLEEVRISDTYNYLDTKELRLEAREKLTRIRPETLGQAGRIPGITPADVAVLSVLVERDRRRAGLRKACNQNGKARQEDQAPEEGRVRS